MAEFLTILHNDGLQPNTIAGYRSAIGVIHSGFQDNSTVSNNPIIHRLIAGSFITRPPVSRLVPAWSLTLVLRKLAGPPFEPMQTASLKYLSLKCAFLLSFASARRVSQITALSIDKDHLVWLQDGVQLSTRAGFLAKNQRINFNPEPIVIRSMGSFSSREEDLVWCPVRALKMYMERTETLRGGCTQLFIKCIAPHNGIRPPTLASWIVETIKLSYPAETSPDTFMEGEPNRPNPRAHDVRGVSASWAKFHKVPIESILQAATWKSETTFATCYVKDVFQAENQFSMRVLSTSASAAGAAPT